MKAVGARLPRYDGVGHVTGRTVYVDDVRVGRTLWVKALRSPHHHATITKFDTSKAEAMKGVYAVITHADVPKNVYGHLEGLGVPYRIEQQDTYSVVKRVIPEGKTMCSLCSRLRRGVLYRVAGELGATRIALGHHRDDILETFMLNLFYTGQLKAMPPKLRSDDGRHVVIRPLAYCEERDLAEYARIREFPIIPCNLCGSQANMKRAEVKRMLREWESRYPGRVETMLNSLRHVRASHLLDRDAFDFRALPPSRAAKKAAAASGGAAGAGVPFDHSDAFQQAFSED